MIKFIYQVNVFKGIVLLIVALFLNCSAQSQMKGYFIGFHDKEGTPHNLERPITFLSERAIVRRINQQIPIDSTDLPVAPHHIDQLKVLGVDVIHTSRWMNGAIVFSDDALLMDTIVRYDFVKSVWHTFTGVSGSSAPGYHPVKKFVDSDYQKVGEDYAKAVVANTTTQLAMLNAPFLHNNGFTGEGMHIAVLDAGFFKVNETDAFEHLYTDNRLAGIKNFVPDPTPFYGTHSHGLHVLSVMAGLIDGSYTGAAPGATYWLFRTEDVFSEYPIEADYWICAAEMADSAGVDIIQSSLGYFQFDDPSLNYTYGMTDGSTRISRAASMASNKGMVVVNSAGNERQRSWHFIIMPSDAPEVLAIGAVDANKNVATFSSAGFSVDQRIKPDVMAMGVATRIISNNQVVSGNGTSYAAPLISGLVACLWQSLPEKTAKEIIQIVRESGDRYISPDSDYGYGIPNFEIAYKLGSILTDSVMADEWLVYPNPFVSELTLHNNSWVGEVVATVFTLAGTSVWSQSYVMDMPVQISIGSALPSGVYFLQISAGSQKVVKKVIKK
jgi:serine protease AprX